jgi:hypothetical protein
MMLHVKHHKKEDSVSESTCSECVAAGSTMKSLGQKRIQVPQMASWEFWDLGSSIETTGVHVRTF